MQAQKLFQHISLFTCSPTKLAKERLAKYVMSCVSFINQCHCVKLYITPVDHASLSSYGMYVTVLDVSIAKTIFIVRCDFVMLKLSGILFQNN